MLFYNWCCSTQESIGKQITFVLLRIVIVTYCTIYEYLVVPTSRRARQEGQMYHVGKIIDPLIAIKL